MFFEIHRFFRIRIHFWPDGRAYTRMTSANCLTSNLMDVYTVQFDTRDPKGLAFVDNKSQQWVNQSIDNIVLCSFLVIFIVNRGSKHYKNTSTRHYVVKVDGDEVVAVGPILLVPETERMEHLVHHRASNNTTGTNRHVHVMVVVVAHSWVTTKHILQY